MSKELDELTRVENNIIYLLSDCSDYDELVECFKSVEEHKSCEIIRNALQRLESIDNANPSEALKWLEKYKLTILFNTTIVENALLKAQEQEKILSIIKEKNVDVLAIKESKTLEEYNRNAWEVEHYGKYRGYKLQLTQEEFDLLKKWSEGE